jgi:hypothetical protein
VVVDQSTLARAAAVLVVVATVLFVSGALNERTRHTETNHLGAIAGKTTIAIAAHKETTETTHNESSETGEATLAASTIAGHDETAETTHNETGVASHTETSEFHPLGINAEQTWLIITAGLAALAVAAALLARPSPATLAVTVLVAAAFALAEIPEAIHQQDVQRWGLLTLALAALVSHVASALVGARAFQLEQRHA